MTLNIHSFRSSLTGIRGIGQLVGHENVETGMKDVRKVTGTFLTGSRIAPSGKGDT